MRRDPFDNIERQVTSTFRLVRFLLPVMIIGSLAVTGAIIYVVAHFLNKVW